MSAIGTHASIFLLGLAVAAGCNDKLGAPAWARERDPAAREAARPAARESDPASADFSDVVARAAVSVVSIVNEHSPPDEDDDEPAHGHPGGPGGHERALGSGFVISADGIVLTSYHVIEGANEVEVGLHDGRTVTAVVIGRDAKLDVALLRLRGAGNIPPIALGSSEVLRVGEPVIAIGNAFGLGPSVTRGILSAKSRTIGAGPYDSFLQTDAAINPGNSGGPLLDREGRVIGINTAIVARGNGVSFAIPIDDVRLVLGELRRTGHVTRGRLGVTFQSMSSSIGRALKISNEAGALVSEVEPGSPAAKGGLRPGDVIVRIDGLTIGRASELSRELGRRKPGDTVKLDVLRERATRTVRARLERLEDERSEPPAPAAKKQKLLASLGGGTLGLRTADAPGGGARVDAVDPEGPCADELKPGDVVVELNLHEVKSTSDLASRVAAAPRPSTVLLRVRRAGSFLYAAIDLT